MRKPIVGETLYSLNVGNAFRASWNDVQKLTPMIVEKIGRKYFTLGGIQFHLDDWREKTEYCRTHELFETEQEWIDKKESDDILSFLREKIDYCGGSTNLTLIQLREIKSIIEVNK